MLDIPCHKPLAVTMVLVGAVLLAPAVSLTTIYIGMTKEVSLNSETKDSVHYEVLTND